MAIGKMAHYRCYGSGLVALAELVRAAGLRWTVEESWQMREG